jgi:nickel/cobalt transporter (NicO) family protein
MALAALIGVSSGAVHAVTGPDHVLSLGPAALRRKRAPWNLGLTWGAGHALGTLLLVLPVLLLARSAYLAEVAAMSDRIAGLALLGMALWSVRNLRVASATGAVESTRSPLLVGFVHGVTGAAALMVMLPVLANGSLPVTFAYLGGFALGSTLAMGALTCALALLAGRLRDRVIGIAQRALLAGAAALGVVWIVG